MRINPSWVQCAVLAAAIGLASDGCRKSTGADAADGAAAPVAVTLYTVRLDNLTTMIEGPGITAPSPAGDLTIFPPETGRIAEMPKAEGDPVQPGDLLVRFEFANLSSAIGLQQAAVSAATARVATAKAQLAKVSALSERGFVARSELDAANAAVANAEMDTVRARQQLEVANAESERATIKARFAGVVAKRFHAEGDLVNGSITDPVMRVVDPSHLQVTMMVPVQDFSRLQQGQAATVVSTDGEHPAVVMLPAALDDPRATSQQIRLAFNGPTTLPVDSPVQVQILLAQRKNVPVLPQSALVRADGRAVYVLVAGSDGRAHRHDVMLGLATKDKVEVLAGVAAGDRVIASEPGTVADGTAIAAGQ